MLHLDMQAKEAHLRETSCCAPSRVPHIMRSFVNLTKTRAKTWMNSQIGLATFHLLCGPLFVPPLNTGCSLLFRAHSDVPQYLMRASHTTPSFECMEGLTASEDDIGESDVHDAGLHNLRGAIPRYANNRIPQIRLW